MHKHLSLLTIFLTISLIVFSQSKRLEYKLQSTLVTSSGNSAAFWGVSNNYGTISTNPHSAALRLGIFSAFDTLRTNKLQYSYGVELLNQTDGSRATLQQYYLKLKYRFISVQGGRIEEFFGNQDSTLSSGGLLWSGNAQPMPKITIGMLNYTAVPYTLGLVEIKGALSHGWFERDAYVKNEWLHHKYAYVRLGGKLPVRFHFGFHHYAQWGGILPNGTHMPSSLADYKTIFLAQQKDTANTPASANNDPNLLPEYSNRIGNHIGSRNLGLEIDTKPANFSLYYQTIFEDNSGYKWHNMKDGLWGVSVHLNLVSWLSNIVYEYLNTTDQSMSWPQDRIAGEPDNYFNHFIYKNGWTYNDFTIGTPLITSPALLKNVDSPNDKSTNYIQNNMVTAHHLAFRGSICNNLVYKFKGTYSLNKGNYFSSDSVRKESVSTYLELTKQLQKLWNFELSVAIAKDFGGMYGNNTSLLVTLRKRGKLL